MATTEQLLADPEFRALPPAQREPLLIDAIAKDAAASPPTGSAAQPIPLDAQGQPTQPLPAGLTSPRVQRGGLSEEGTFEQETTPTAESRRAMAPFIPGTARGLRENLVGTPQQYADYVNAQRPTPAQSQGAKEGLLPAAGSLLGTAAGYGVGGPVGAAIGDVLGTTAGYAGNVALGVEKFDPMKAALTIAPTAAANAYTGVIRPALSGLAKSSRAGKQAQLGEKTAKVDAINTRIQDFNTQQMAQEGAQRTAFEQGEAAQGLRSEITRSNITQFNAQQEANDAASRLAFEQGETAKKMARERAITGTQQYNQGVTAAQGNAQNVVDTFNARTAADFEVAQALQARTQAEGQAAYQSDLASWQAVLEKQRADRVVEGERLRNLTRLQREGNVGKAAQFVHDLPGVPTPDAVKESYAEVDALAKSYKVPIVLGEVQKAQKALAAQAESLRKVPGGAALATQLETVSQAGEDSTLTLGDIQTALSFMKNHLRTLARSSGEYASTQRRVYGQLIDAMETGLQTLATSEAIPDSFRASLKLANAQYLKATTHQELTDFLTHDLLVPGPGGALQFSPQAGLKALERPGNAQLKKYLQQTTFEELGGKDLYTLTKETLTTMAGKDFAEAEGIRAVRRQLMIPPAGKPVDPSKVPGTPSAVPIKPVQLPPPQSGQLLTPPGAYKPQPYVSAMTPVPVPPPYAPRTFQPTTQLMSKIPAPTGDTTPGMGATVAGLGMQAGLLTGAGLAASQGGLSGYGGAGLAFGTAAFLPQMVAGLLMTPQGQKTLLALTQAQGPRVTPTMMGFLTAATRSMLPSPAETAPSGVP